MVETLDKLKQDESFDVVVIGACGARMAAARSSAPIALGELKTHAYAK